MLKNNLVVTEPRWSYMWIAVFMLKSFMAETCTLHLLCCVKTWAVNDMIQVVLKSPTDLADISSFYLFVTSKCWVHPKQDKMGQNRRILNELFNLNVHSSIFCSLFIFRRSHSFSPDEDLKRCTLHLTWAGIKLGTSSLQSNGANYGATWIWKVIWNQPFAQNNKIPVYTPNIIVTFFGKSEVSAALTLRLTFTLKTLRRERIRKRTFF